MFLVVSDRKRLTTLLFEAELYLVPTRSFVSLRYPGWA